MTMSIPSSKVTTIDLPFVHSVTCMSTQCVFVILQVLRDSFQELMNFGAAHLNLVLEGVTQLNRNSFRCEEQGAAFGIPMPYRRLLDEDEGAREIFEAEAADELANEAQDLGLGARNM